MDSRTVRRKFIDYFARQGHREMRSASLIPRNDPTLYFANAGMVPFKDVFAGTEARPCARACSAQKCLRVSGKHNDLEAVGRTPKHHTFFEMLGNFSFGDYFKREAIQYAWEFLTVELGLPAERMVATVFHGEDGVPADEQAYAIWHDEIGLPAQRIFRLGKADNFWSMGSTGPCGPCTEIHLLPETSGSVEDALTMGGPETDDRWIEVWNLVFMQFNRHADGGLNDLEQTGVDTGMGLERLTALANGLASTYDTDLLRPLIELASELSDRPYGAAEDTDVSLRVLADHARATAFCIADGVFPEKGGREYVLRRIMRRAIRHGQLLGLEQPFFEQMCLRVVELMGDDYPELREHREVMAKLVAAEETTFRRTLSRGLQKLQQTIAQTRKRGDAELPAAFVGDLYATDGFPIDLTRLIAEEADLLVEDGAAHVSLKETHGAGETKVGDAAIAPVYKQLRESLGASEFVGYEQVRVEGTVRALIQQGRDVARAAEGEAVEIVVDQTPFYGRAGGQLGDTGMVTGPHGEAKVLDVLRPDGELIVHCAELKKGHIERGDRVELSVDAQRRQAIRLNHSATHLLHHALRTVLGPHVTQKGSEVGPTHLRFDFSHFEALSAEQIARLEQLVNEEIRGNIATRTELTSYEQARQSGAMALFGEKYADTVRAVHVGSRSVELCGGTHVAHCGDIGLFRIVSEEASALGVRRIVATTGETALSRDQRIEAQLRDAAYALKAAPEQVGERIAKLQQQLRGQEREIGQLKRSLATGGGSSDLMERVRTIAGLKVLATRAAAGDPKTLREAGDALRDRIGSGLVVLGGEHDGTARLLVMVSKDLTNRLHAGKLVGQLAQHIGGKGGGRPDMAQAGGPAVEQLDEALAQAPMLVERSLPPPTEQ